MNKLLLAILLSNALVGCSLIPKVESKLVDAVEGYCETVDPDERKFIRERTNASLKAKAKNPSDPAQVCGVYCPGDKAVPQCAQPNGTGN